MLTPFPFTCQLQRYREDNFEEDHAAPYQVVLDTGRFIYSPSKSFVTVNQYCHKHECDLSYCVLSKLSVDDDDCIKKSSLPPPELRFSVGDKVKCIIERGWEPGIIANVDVLNGERLYPYGIKLDYNGDIVYAPCDNDMFIRKILRFREGQRVDCYTEEDGWMTGEVDEVEIEIENDDDPYDSQVIPYRVLLDNDDELYVDMDEDSCIRQSTRPRGCRNEHNDGFVHVISRMLINNEEYEEAKEMLQEKIEIMRYRIKTNSSNGDVANWRVNLSHFLTYLAEVYQATGSLEEMKLALVEAMVLTKLSNDKSKPHRLLDISSKMATYSTLNGDNRTALKYSEEAILLVKQTTFGQDSFRLGSLLVETGKLNIACNMRDRGLTQMSDGIKILDRLCGSDNSEVVKAMKEYDLIVKEGEGKSN